MKRYRPTLTALPDGGVEQAYDANVVHLEDALIAFGEILPDDPRGLPFGTPVHSLLVHCADGGAADMLELNEEGNTVDADEVARTELTADHVRFVFRDGAGPYPGRVGLSPEIEVFEDEEFDDVPLSSLLIRFTIDDAKLAELRRRLPAIG